MSPKKRNRDGFELHFWNIIVRTIGEAATAYLAVTFHEVDGKCLCQVMVEPSNDPIYVKESQGQEILYLRTGNSTRPLPLSEAVKYVRIRWGTSGPNGTLDERTSTPLEPWEISGARTQKFKLYEAACYLVPVNPAWPLPVEALEEYGQLLKTIEKEDLDKKDQPGHDTLSFKAGFLKGDGERVSRHTSHPRNRSPSSQKVSAVAEQIHSGVPRGALRRMELTFICPLAWITRCWC